MSSEVRHLSPHTDSPLPTCFHRMSGGGKYEICASQLICLWLLLPRTASYVDSRLGGIGQSLFSEIPVLRNELPTQPGQNLLYAKTVSSIMVSGFLNMNLRACCAAQALTLSAVCSFCIGMILLNPTTIAGVTTVLARSPHLASPSGHGALLLLKSFLHWRNLCRLEKFGTNTALGVPCTCHKRLHSAHIFTCRILQFS